MKFLPGEGLPVVKSFAGTKLPVARGLAPVGSRSGPSVLSETEGFESATAAQSNGGKPPRHSKPSSPQQASLATGVGAVFADPQCLLAQHGLLQLHCRSA
ncbi:hypothetical protein C9I49_07360 [Pseudomonas prosekii]|uniref:Uncharacterized protein n=1 Tax=Pseudomonas prosekii TaxID=1148509 RepID=A0A2U2DBL5_9PSED|nr:hypothetical protein C9I49_07360 [Pseudomonas prosekii]